MSKPPRKKTLKAAGEQPVAVKLDKESGCVIDDRSGDERGHGTYRK